MTLRHTVLFLKTEEVEIRIKWNEEAFHSDIEVLFPHYTQEAAQQSTLFVYKESKVCGILFVYVCFPQ